jgi:hypothetical protein
LYKIFIQSQFDYCSSLFIHLLKQDRDRLERCFRKSIARLLKINLQQNDHKVQFSILIKYNILPLFYRQFFHFISFLFKLIIFKHSVLCSKLCKYTIIKTLRKLVYERETTTTPQYSKKMSLNIPLHEFL